MDYLPESIATSILTFVFPTGVQLNILQTGLLLLLTIVGLTSCTSDTTTPGDVVTPSRSQPPLIVLSNGLVFDFSSNTVIDSRNRFDIPNPIAIAYSRNREYLLASYALNHETPELFLYKLGSLPVQVTDNAFVESKISVNSKGEFAYVLSEGKGGTTEIFVGEHIVDSFDASAIVDGLALGDEFLVFGWTDRRDDASYVSILDLNTRLKTVEKLSGPVQSILAHLPGRFAIQLFLPPNKTLQVLDLDAKGASLTHIIESTGSQYMYLQVDGSLRIDDVSGNHSLYRLYNALHSWSTVHLANGMARSNNFFGRLTWHVSYVMEGLLQLAEQTHHRAFQYQLESSAQAILAARNRHLLPDVSNVSDDCWATLKYSLHSDTPVCLFVDDARILYPLLLLARDQAVPSDLRIAILELGKRFVDRIDTQFDEHSGLYRIAYGVDFWADGVWAPYNWQSAIGLVLLELYSATGVEAYGHRASTLARRFRSEWELSDDGRALWHYWPSEFYAGWSAADSVSINSPTRPQTIDLFHEDVSHAGINVKFILEHRKVFGESIFSDDDVVAVQEAIKKFVFGETFSNYIGGDQTETRPSYRFIPVYGWAELGDATLSPYYEAYIPYFHPADILAYLAERPVTSADDRLTISSHIFNESMTEISQETRELNHTGILQHFGL